MELFDFQTTLTVTAILAATAVVVLFDYLRRRRRIQQPQPLKISKPARVKRLAPVFNAPALNYSPYKKMACERPSITPAHSLVAVATPTRPPVEPRIERETVTVEMAPPSPSVPSAAAETSSAVLDLRRGQLPPIAIDVALWDRLIASASPKSLFSSDEVTPKPLEKTPPVPRVHSVMTAEFKTIQETNASGHQPGGLIQPSTLEKWLETEQRFTGLVVSIGINDGDSSMWHSQGLVQSVGYFIAGLLRAKDSYCRTSYDEFLIVCPGDMGAQSQRRLKHISERLWDYQLRGLGPCSILFSWGGVQVENQPLAEAVASATERMRETKRSSKSALAQHQVV